jgi:hypothetical protein
VAQRRSRHVATRRFGLLDAEPREITTAEHP